MTLYVPTSDTCIDLKEGAVSVLVVENPIALRNIVVKMKESGADLTLSEYFVPVEFSKKVELIDNIFEVDFSAKKILSKINAEAESCTLEYPEETFDVISRLNEFGTLIASAVDFPIKYSFSQETDKIIKLLDFSIDTEKMTIPEKLLSYMDICRKFFGEKVFVFLNLKSFLSRDELELFYKSVEYERFYALLLESEHRGQSLEKYEKIVIVDEDLCII